MLLDEVVLCVELLDEAVLCVEFDLDRAVVGVPDCGCSLPCSDPSGCSNSGSSEFCGCSYSNSCPCGCSCWSTWPNLGSNVNSGSLGPVPIPDKCVCLYCAVILSTSSCGSSSTFLRCGDVLVSPNSCGVDGNLILPVLGVCPSGVPNPLYAVIDDGSSVPCEFVLSCIPVLNGAVNSPVQGSSHVLGPGSFLVGCSVLSNGLVLSGSCGDRASGSGVLVSGQSSL